MIRPIRDMTYGIISIIFGTILFKKGFDSLKEKRTIENIPTSKIRSIAIGMVELNGKVISNPKDTLISPLSNKKCVYYSCLIEEYKNSERSSHWETIHKEIKGDYFYLKDNTGTILISTEGADIDIKPSYTWSKRYLKKYPEEVIKYLNNNNIKHKSLLGFNKTLRITEYTLEIDKELYILGNAVKNPFNKTSDEDVSNLMIKKGEFFVISDKAENKIINKLKWKSFRWIFGGSLLMIIGFIIFIKGIINI